MSKVERRYLPSPPDWGNGEDRRDPDASSWMIIYLDVMTLMLSVFVVLLAYSTYSPEKFDELARTLSQTVAVQDEVVVTIEPELQLQETQAVIDEPAQVETEQLREQFRQALLDQGLEESVEIIVTSNRIDLQIRERILFQLGRADLTVGGQDLLGRLVPLLNDSEDNISVEGHTDNIPISNERFPSNWELSAQRATQVLRHLITQGVSSERLRAIGYADTHPVADNATEDGRARNRRVSLVLHMDN